jgi:hypothetical protein
MSVKFTAVPLVVATDVRNVNGYNGPAEVVTFPVTDNTFADGVNVSINNVPYGILYPFII